jgi:cardiolipin synthase A/B
VLDLLLAPGPPLLAALVLAALAATLVSGHVLLTKEEPRAGIGWIALVWLSPLVGGILYLVLGINRVRRRALQLRPRGVLTASEADPRDDTDLGGLAALARAMDHVSGSPLLAGNAVRLLDSGDEAYPEMLAAIDAAERSVALCTYIFDRDRVGRQFVDALGRAVARGVEVRVLVDGLGARYSFPTVLPLLRRRGVRAVRFLPARPWSVAFLNLRNHRKILVVDGRIGFTGGMNLRKHHVLAEPSHTPTRDLMVRVEGPVVAQLMEVFAADWGWTTGEALTGAHDNPWFASTGVAGGVQARVVRDGPDEDLDKALLTFVSALACARRSVRIVTPYFLPEEALVTALHAAALRGVEVDVLLPEVNNLPYMTWAARAELPRVLAYGVRAWWVPPPFDHTKLVVVDGRWALFGSANWDARSLRLNFELLLEAYDGDLGARAEAAALARRARARPVSVAELQAAPLPVRLRDAAARLAKPYL